MKQFTINGQTCNIPECWEEVTLEQLLKLNTGVTRSLELISIFTIPETELSKIKDLKLIEQIESCLLNFTNTQINFEELFNQKPSKFVFKGEEVSLPSDIGDSSIGQYQDMKFEVSEYFKEDGQEIDVLRRLSVFPKVVAIYLQPIVTSSEYDWKKAEQISQELYKHSAVEVACWGNFFILKFSELRTGIMKDVQALTTLQKKVKPGSQTSLKSLAGKLFSTTSQAETSKSKTT